jgi:hypothetical protein
MLFISDTDPLGGLTAAVTASHEDCISDNCEITLINTMAEVKFCLVLTLSVFAQCRRLARLRFWHLAQSSVQG